MEGWRLLGGESLAKEEEGVCCCHPHASVAKIERFGDLQKLEDRCCKIDRLEK